MRDTDSGEQGEGGGASRQSDGARGAGGWVVRTLVAAAALAALFGAAWYAAEAYREGGSEATRADARAEGAAATDAAARTRTSSGRSRWLSVRAPVVTFPTLPGDTASLAAHRGDVVVLNFWATWCPPCEREIPELARLQDSLRAEGVTVVGVAVSSGSREKIRSFGEEHGINYPVWLSDPGTAATEYDAVGLPLTLLVDRNGVIRRRYMGPQTYETLSDDVRALLDSTSAPGGERPGASATDLR